MFLQNTEFLFFNWGQKVNPAPSKQHKSLLVQTVQQTREGKKEWRIRRCFCIAFSSFQGRGRSVSSEVEVEFISSATCAVIVLCSVSQVDYTRHVHVNEGLEIGCLKTETRKQVSSVGGNISIIQAAAETGLKNIVCDKKKKKR